MRNCSTIEWIWWMWLTYFCQSQFTRYCHMTQNLLRNELRDVCTSNKTSELWRIGCIAWSADILWKRWIKCNGHVFKIHYLINYYWLALLWESILREEMLNKKSILSYLFIFKVHCTLMVERFYFSPFSVKLKTSQRPRGGREALNFHWGGSYMLVYIC